MYFSVIMVRCSNCGAEVENSTFCFNCGEKLNLSGSSSTSNVCPKCGVVNNEDTI